MVFSNKKKGGRTGTWQGELEDLDKILAELGEGPVVSDLAPTTSTAVLAEKGKEADVEVMKTVETAKSAAAKRKRKRKEKEKEKKAAAAAASAEADESKGKVSKKLPKRIREMQEALSRMKEAEERRKREEEEWLRKEEEEIKREEEEERLAEEKRRRKKERQKEKLLKKKQEGKLLTGKQKEEQRRLEAMRRQFLAQRGEALGTSQEVKRKPKYGRKTQKPMVVAKEAVEDVREAHNDVEESQYESSLRSPICCVLGHVNAGKTKLLDCIRFTNVQKGEAGGITQQIGATYFPIENIRERTKELKEYPALNVPGLLVIDTPGHESFANMRLRGSSLCDIAILVVDITDKRLKPQTIESLNMLKSRGTDFIVALNKVDRLYGWKRCPNAPILRALEQQKKHVKGEFYSRLAQIMGQFQMEGLNTQLYNENEDMEEVHNIIPTSAISGEGIPDLLLHLVQPAKKTMEEKLTYIDEVQCTVLEVKVTEGLGTTIDVVLVNGILHEGDQIIVCGMQEPIITTIRALMTPHPMKELRVKGKYQHHKYLKATQGVKISAQGLKHAVAGTALYVVKPGDNIEPLKDVVMQDIERLRGRIAKSGVGVHIQASTLGSLEALIEYLKLPQVNVPFSGFSIGPVHKKDVMKASAMLEKRRKEYAAILAFDVKVTPEARKLAKQSGVLIFEADIIYRLFDQFKAYIDESREEQKRESAEEGVFPCVFKYNKLDYLINPA